MKTLLSIFICIVIIISFTSNGYCQIYFKCGNEYRIITKDHIEYRGRLLKNNRETITLSGGTSIAFSNVESVCYVKRNALVGGVLGTVVGIPMGILVANKWKENQGEGWYIGEVLGITTGVAILGCITGALIGHHTPTIYKLNLKTIPFCSNPSGDIMPLKVNLTYNF